MILVTGASGAIPQSAIQALLKANQPVRILARDPKKVTFNAEIAQGDLTQLETLAAAFRGVSAVFLVTPAGPDMVAMHENALAAAKAAGVKKMVKVSAWGATPEAPVALGRWHGKTDQALRESGMQWVVLQPHGFMQNTLGYAGTIKAQNTIYAPLGTGHVCYIDSRDIGEVAAKVLQSDAWNNRNLELTGPEAFSYAQLAQTFSGILGRQINYVDVPQDAARQAMTGMGMPTWLIDDLLILSGFYAANYASTPTKTVEEVLGHKGRDLTQFIQDHAALY